MDVGTELRAARESAGLSLEQIAKNTKIQVAKLEALEANQFDRLPQGVYLEGIVRAYAKEVGVDGHPLIAQIYAEPELAPVRHIDATARYDLDTFNSESEVPAIPETRIPSQPDFAMPPPPPTGPAMRPPAGARFRASHAALAMLALAASFGLGWYLFTAAGPDQEARRSSGAPVSRDAVRAATADDVDGTRPPDSAPRGTDSAAAARDSGATTSRDTDSTPRNDDATATRRIDSTVARGSDAAAARDNTATEPGSIGAGEARANATDASAAMAGDFSGTWRLETEIQSTSVRTFEGLQLGYRLQLDQRGQQISGRGEKISENGRALPAAARTPIAVTGTVEGNQLALTFIERGARRSTRGAFVLQRRDDGTLRGRFSSDAAQSSGLVAARRPQG